MNDKFAKDTHNALQHRPVYQKRNRQLPSSDGKKEKESHSPPNKRKSQKKASCLNYPKERIKLNLLLVHQ